MNASPAVRESYLNTLPSRPYCTNTLGRKPRILDATLAVRFAYLQHNSPLVWRWLIFDIDAADSYTRAESRGCPPPNFIALNRENGHGHLGYLLENPVTLFANSSHVPVKFCEDVERGMTHRLGADLAYAGFLAKNPLHERWETQWQAVRPYRLETLNDYLDKSDKSKPDARMVTALARNDSLFQALRKWAYGNWLRIKSSGGKHADLLEEIQRIADGLNASFTTPLSAAEIRGICRSVAKWVWGNFSLERFSEIQRRRAGKRWNSAPTLTATKPWEALGVSRRTWERRRAQSP